MNVRVGVQEYVRLKRYLKKLGTINQRLLFHETFGDLQWESSAFRVSCVVSLAFLGRGEREAVVEWAKAAAAASRERMG